MKRFLILVFLTLITCMPVTGWGQEESQAEKPAEAQKEEKPIAVLPPIKVVAPRLREQADRAESVTIITREEIEEDRAVGAYDDFKRTPGINVGQGTALGFGLGQRGTAGATTIRGLGRNFGENRVRGILVLTDDVPGVSISHGHPFPDVYTTDDLERIEIIKGPSSVLHGSAMVGVIKLTTMEPGPGWTSRVQSSGGSFGTTENRFRVAYGGERGFALLSGNFRRSDGHRANSAFQAGDGNIKLGRKLGEDFTVTFGGGGGHVDFENPQQVGGPPPTNKTGEIDYFSGYASLVGRFARSETSIKLWVVDNEVRFNEGTTKEPNLLYGAKLKETLHLFKGNFLTLGADVMNYSAARNDIDPDSITEGAPYLFVEQIFTEAFKINGGVRVTFNEQFGTDVSPEVGLVFKPFHGTALRARVARGFRAPNFFELDFLTQANPDLEPSSLVQYEVGINQQVEDWLTLDLVGFLQDGDNMIRRVPDPTAVGGFRFANTGEFFHKGLEAQAELLLLNDLSLFAAATILDVQDDTALIPQNTYDFGVGYTPGNFSITLTGRYINRLFNQDNNKDRIDDSFVANARLSYSILKHYEAFVEIENFTDADYELVKGFPLPGISAYAGLSAVF